MRRFIISLLFIFIGTFSSAFAQVYHKVQGTNLWVVPPQNYETSRNFTGFINNKTGGSILVLNLPYSNAQKAYDEFNNPDAFIKTMKAQGFDIDGSEQSTTQDGISFRVYHGTQKNDGTLYYRWVSMFFVKQAAYVVSVQTLEPNELDQAIILKLYQQMRFMGEHDIPEAISALPYTITPAAPFVIDAILMGNTVQLGVPTNKDSPHIMVSMDAGYALSPDDVANAQKLYLASIATSFQVNLDDCKSTQVDFAGSKGLLLEGTAKTNQGNINFMLFTAVGKDGRIFYLHATGKKDQLEKYQTQINDIVKSIIPRVSDTIKE